MKKILIIGSKGFIGTHLLNYFRQLAGIEVWGCDVIADYVDSNYFQVDASNSDYNELFSSNFFEVCINCSGSAKVPDSLHNPARDFYLNTINVFKILDAIRKNAPKCKFLNLSSAAVYGNPKHLPVSEKDAVQPLSPYGWHKYQSELLCKEFHEVFDLSTCSIRIFSAFGTGLQKQIFWDWYQKARYYEQVTLIGTGNESRDFIYIDDLVEALHCVLNNGSFDADIINLANGEEITISGAAKIFKQHMRGRFNYCFNKTVRIGDPINWKADISKLSALGYKKKVDFELGISKYIKWLDERE